MQPCSYAATQLRSHAAMQLRSYAANARQLSAKIRRCQQEQVSLWTLLLRLCWNRPERHALLNSRKCLIYSCSWRPENMKASQKSSLQNVKSNRALVRGNEGGSEDRFKDQCRLVQCDGPHISVESADRFKNRRWMNWSQLFSGRSKHYNEKCITQQHGL